MHRAQERDTLSVPLCLRLMMLSSDQAAVMVQTAIKPGLIAGYRRIPPDNREALVIEVIDRDGSITAAQASELLGLSTRSIRELLNRMVSDGLIEKNGAARSTYYSAPGGN
jgi:predicted HTH transcriptional regulator